MAEDIKRRRRSIRLRGYDYSLAGVYFVTVCTAGRVALFSEILDGEMRLNDAGRELQEVWCGLPAHYAGVQTDAFIVMPNHIHGIIILTKPVGAGFKPAPTGAERLGLPEIVRAFKTFSARRINEQHKTSGQLWQRGYYEHIIRRGESLDSIREYILTNPSRWQFDRENPGRTPRGRV